MKTASLHPGAEVEVDIRGRRFPARVTAKPSARQVPIEPLVANNSFRCAGAHQVKKTLCPAGDEQLTMEGSG